MMSSQLSPNSSGVSGEAITKDGDKSPTRNPPKPQGHEGLDKPSGLCRVFNPPKLEKKHSSGDLISRLKTRKILGVGETDNGDIHRSKISQVLGHNEHLYVRLPRGYWIAHVCLGLEVTFEALVLLFAPNLAVSMGLMPPTTDEEVYPPQAIRMAGGALIGIVVLVWSLLGTTDKHYARTVLMAILMYHAITAFLSAGTAFVQGGLSERWIRTIVGLRTVLCLVCLGYFHRIGEPGSGVRKSASYISKDDTKVEQSSKLSSDFDLQESDNKKEK